MQRPPSYDVYGRPAPPGHAAAGPGYYQHNVSAAVDSMRNMHVSGSMGPHSGAPQHSGAHGLMH
jgi:hypothetical protein